MLPEQACSNPTQQITVSPRRGPEPILSAHEKTLVLQGLAIIRETLQARQVGDEGLRQNGANACNYSLKTTSEESVGAQVGAIISLSQVVAMLIERWDELGDVVKAEIAELLKRV